MEPSFHHRPAPSVAARRGLEIDALSLAQPDAMSRRNILDKFEGRAAGGPGRSRSRVRSLAGGRAGPLPADRPRDRRKPAGANAQDPEAAIDAAEQLLAIDRTHEGAWRTIMRSHMPNVATWRRRLVSYERCRARPRRESAWPAIARNRGPASTYPCAGHALAEAVETQSILAMASRRQAIPPARQSAPATGRVCGCIGSAAHDWRGE